MQPFWEVLDCDTPLFKPVPLSPSGPVREQQGAWMACSITAVVNDALRTYKAARCGGLREQH